MFRLEHFCPSLSVIFDEIPDLFWMFLPFLPMTILKLIEYEDLPSWFIALSSASSFFFWTRAAIKFKSCLRRSCLRIIDVLFIGLSLLFIVGACIMCFFNTFR